MDSDAAWKALTDAMMEAARVEGAARERAAVVAWLRKILASLDEEVARAIRAGDHARGETDGET